MYSGTTLSLHLESDIFRGVMPLTPTMMALPTHSPPPPSHEALPFTPPHGFQVMSKFYPGAIYWHLQVL